MENNKFIIIIMPKINFFFFDFAKMLNKNAYTYDKVKKKIQIVVFNWYHFQNYYHFFFSLFIYRFNLARDKRIGFDKNVSDSFWFIKGKIKKGKNSILNHQTHQIFDIN